LKNMIALEIELEYFGRVEREELRDFVFAFNHASCPEAEGRYGCRWGRLGDYS